MDYHQGQAVRLVEIIMVIEMKVFGKANVQVLCTRSMSRLFYKPSFKLFVFPLPYPYNAHCKNNAAFFLLCFCMQPLLILLSYVALRMRLHKTAFGRFTAE